MTTKKKTVTTRHDSLKSRKDQTYLKYAKEMTETNSGWRAGGSNMPVKASLIRDAKTHDRLSRSIPDGEHWAGSSGASIKKLREATGKTNKKSYGGTVRRKK